MTVIMDHGVKQKLYSQLLCCHWQDCLEQGEYPAPKKIPGSKEYVLFCLKHVRMYNKDWNYFDGMSQEAAIAFQHDSITGHRPTKKNYDTSYIFSAADVWEETVRHFGFEEVKSAALPQATNEELEAIQTLNLRYPVTLNAIKKQYKILAKTCHPDIHGSEGEERFKQINKAYHCLKRIYA